MAEVRLGPPRRIVLSWLASLALPAPAPGAARLHVGYQVWLAGLELPLAGAATTTAFVAAGASDATGNRGALTPKAAAQRVDRTPPPPPGAFDVAELLASRPDHYGKSSFTLSWAAAGVERYLVHRAVDVALFKLHGLTDEDARAMTTADLTTLAGRAASAAAFVLVNPAPLAATTFTDTGLEGHARNRYFCRVRAVSAAGVVGELGPSTPPVAIPDVVPPRAPIARKALGGEDTITITFAPIASMTSITTTSIAR